MNARDILLEQEIEYEKSLALDIAKEEEEQRKAEAKEREQEEARQIQQQLEEDERNRLTVQEMRLQRLKFFEDKFGAGKSSERPPSLPTRCSGITKKGLRCKLKALKGTMVCKIHSSQNDQKNESDAV